VCSAHKWTLGSVVLTNGHLGISIPSAEIFLSFAVDPKIELGARRGQPPNLDEGGMGSTSEPPRYLERRAKETNKK